MLGAPGLDFETWETSSLKRFVILSTAKDLQLLFRIQPIKLGAPGLDFETWETSSLKDRSGRLPQRQPPTPSVGSTPASSVYAVVGVLSAAH